MAAASGAGAQGADEDKENDYFGEFILLDKNTGEPLGGHFAYLMEYDDKVLSGSPDGNGCTERACTQKETTVNLVGVFQRRPIIPEG
jgi:hypothetical protein